MESQPREIISAPKSSDGRVQLIPPWAVIDAYDIKESIGGVQGVSVRGLGFVREFGAQVKDVLGGSATGIEKEYEKAYADSVTKLRKEAENLGADSVINFTVDQDLIIDPESQRMMIQAIAEGVAVRLKDRVLEENNSKLRYRE